MILINRDITLETFGLLIHGVNCKHKLGSGVALAFKRKWPIIYTEYMCEESGKKMLGKLHIIKVADDLYVGNGYSQEFYGYDGKRYASVEAIDLILQKAFSWCHLNKIQLKSPKIGSKLGGLDWDTEVAPLFVKYETQFETQAEIYYI
ncbi:MAG: hypothetical protein JWP44_5023 [Mucilaginibacter sp.]|nr:hypothetical protein [Mucilaginibacter sp.]